MPSRGPLTIPEADHYFEFRGCDSGASIIPDLQDQSVNATIINGPVECSISGMRILTNQLLDVTPFEFGGDFTVEIVFKLNDLSSTYIPAISFGDNKNGIFGSGTIHGIHLGGGPQAFDAVFGGSYLIFMKFESNNFLNALTKMTSYNGQMDSVRTR